MGKKWTNAEQNAWLEEKIPAYLKAKVNKNKADFLLLTQEEWFKKFPEREVLFPSKSPSETLSAEEEKSLAQAITIRQKQVDGWLDWRARKIKRDVSTQPAVDFSSLRSLINSEAAKNADRAPQKNEVYLRLYPEKVKAVYDSRPEPAIRNAGVRLNQLKAIAQELHDKDTDEVKKEVDDEILKWRQEKVESIRKLEASGSKAPPPTPAEYQSALKRMPLLLSQMMEPLARATGWSFAVLCGGPVPASKGEPCTSHYHYGPTTPAGNDFSDSYAGFITHVMNPYSLHIMKCFSEDVRNQRSLETQQDTDVTPPISGADQGHKASASDPSETRGETTILRSSTNTGSSTAADAHPGSPISKTRPSSVSPNSPSPEMSVDGTDVEDEDPLDLGTFSFSDNRLIFDSTTRTEKASDHVEQDMSSEPIDRRLILSPHSRDADLPLPASSTQEKDSALCVVEPQSPSRILHPGGPTESLSHALLRDSMQSVAMGSSPISTSVVTSSDQSACQGGTFVIDPALLEPTTTIPPSQSSLLDSAVKDFVYNSAESDYTIRGARFNPSQTPVHDNETDNVTANANSPIQEPPVDTAANSSIQEPAAEATNSAIQKPDTDENPQSIGTITQTKKRARVQSKVSNPPERIGLRVRKTAKFGPTIVADQAAPTKRVKHSWTYASDNE